VIEYFNSSSTFLVRLLLYCRRRRRSSEKKEEEGDIPQLLPIQIITRKEKWGLD